MIEDCNSTIENLKGELQSAESRITNLETQTQETPRKVEIHIPTPQPSPPVQTREVPIEKKPKPMNIFNDHIKENNSRNITYFSSQNEDISSIEKQIRSITETANFFKQSIDIIHNKLKEIDDKNSKTFNQQNLKFNQIQEEIDSLKSKFKRLNEQFIRHHTSDYSKVLNEINNKIDKLEKVTNELSNTPTKTMNRVMYPNIKYVDRVLPPLHTNDEQITKIISNNNNDSNEQFGLLDNSDISTSNTSDNLSETSSSILLSSRSNNTENNELNENENLDLKNDKKKSKKSKNQIKTDVKLKIIRHANNNSRPSTATTSLIITQDEIDQKVDTSITNSLNGFLDRIKIEVQKEIKNGLKTIDTVITKIDQKIDRDFVERMFNKFRVVIGELNEKIEQIQTTFLGWVTRDELQEALQLFAEQMKEVKDTAVGSSKYRCLLCGKPRTHVSGMIINGNSDDDEDEIDKPQNNSAIKNNTKLPSNFKVAKRGDTTVVPRNVVQFLTGK
ncbi:hypothetical protein GPJ56_000210 [Histomonas meleagridis]|uniref:uncharacterized protein n=1 Tax=Histomonas meleagridis TaxID=135588 RepID=UPI00355ABA1F|nr:hypothetical protein GPJ56_000210 [Histomonas meleagridis]KAH0799697.1 hypothetical protein GO595_007418 [Histomonas meleagridis]